MRLLDYLPTPFPERMDALSVLADKVGSSAAYLNLVTLGHKTPSHKLARLISAATGGAVGLSDLRPDIWPALAKSAKRKKAA